MGFYSTTILPWAINRVMRHGDLTRERQALVPDARGVVLEVGIGSALNLAYYGPGVERVIGVDPSEKLLAYAERAATGSPFPVDLLPGSAEDMPVASDSVDTVLFTWTLCSVDDAQAALREAQRVLRSGGRLLFVEHGQAPDASVARWQDRITPVWKRLSGGCHLNRPMRQLVEDAGMRFTRLDASYIPGPRPFTYFYRGVATL